MNIIEYLLELAHDKDVTGTDESILDFAKIIIRNRFTMAEVKYIEENS